MHARRASTVASPRRTVDPSRRSPIASLLVERAGLGSTTPLFDLRRRVDWAHQDAGALPGSPTIRRVAPRDLTFGPDGLYGHSDHVAIGELTARARQLASDASAFSEQRTQGFGVFAGSRLFHPVLTGAAVAQLMDAARSAGVPASLWGLGPEHFHVQASEITVRVDVRAVLDQKLAALRCQPHAARVGQLPRPT